MVIKYPLKKEMTLQRSFGASCCQSHMALFVFEWLLNNIEVDAIVELGTGRGGLSLFLLFQAQVRGLKFYTFDALYRIENGINFETANPPVNIAKVMSGYFYQMWLQKKCPGVPKPEQPVEEETVKFIGDILKSNRVLMYCDNGNKPLELKTYAPFITKGSVIGVHDWHPSEFVWIDVPAMERDLKLEVVMSEVCDENKTLQRFWYKYDN